MTGCHPDGRVIQVYELGPDAVGQPLEEVYGAAVPRSLRGAKRYMIEDGRVIDRLKPGEAIGYIRFS